MKAKQIGAIIATAALLALITFVFGFAIGSNIYEPTNKIDTDNVETVEATPIIQTVIETQTETEIIDATEEQLQEAFDDGYNQGNSDGYGDGYGQGYLDACEDYSIDVTQNGTIYIN